jgi:hypothetical protein
MTTIKKIILNHFHILQFPHQKGQNSIQSYGLVYYYVATSTVKKENRNCY